MKQITKHTIGFGGIKMAWLLAMLFTVSALVLITAQHVQAATTIIVNSTADDESDDGECTLREAITAANADTASGVTPGECEAGSGTDTINFTINEVADYTNGGQDGYTILPGSPLPLVGANLTINGYSQPGSSDNSTVAPAAFDAIILIEIDGTNQGTGDGLRIAGNNVAIRGLAVNNAPEQGIGIGADNATIQGNYLGTDPTGINEKGNTFNGVAHIQNGSENALIGGLDPEDRNIISGNDGGGSSPNTGDNNWTYQGNYVGVDATGLVALPNSDIGGSGGLSLDNSNGHIVGGSETGAINVISGNNSHGIAPHNSDNLNITGNYIGYAADGTTVLGNGSAGITTSDSDNALISDNLITDSALDGIFLNNVTNSTVIDNTVDLSGQNGIGLGVGATNNIIQTNTVTNTTQAGISLYQVGIDNEILENTVNDATQNAISVSESDETIVDGNIIDAPGTYAIYNNDANSSTITNNEITNAVGGGVFVSDSTLAVVQQNTVSDSDGYDIELSNVSESSVLTNTLSDAALSSIRIYSTSSGISVEGNQIDNAGEDSIYTNDSEDILVDVNTITDSGEDGIQVDDVAGAIVSNNSVSNSTQNNIDINLSSDVSVDSNTLSTTTVGYGIEVDDTPSIALANNIISGSASSGVSVEGSNGSSLSGDEISTSTLDGINVNDSDDVVISGVSVSDVGNNSLDFSNGSSASTVSDSTFIGGGGDGINIGDDGSHVITGNLIRNHEDNGISINNASDNVIGGVTPGDRNIISNNAGQANIQIVGFGVSTSGNTIIGNYIGTNSNGSINNSYIQGTGIILTGLVNGSIIGGESMAAGNVIAGNSAAGIAIAELSIEGFGVLTPANNTILGNDIFSNEDGTNTGFNIPGLGIDGFTIELDGTFAPTGIIDDGPHLADVGDSDAGPNAFMNPPVIQSVVQDGNDVTLNYDLDAADGLNDEYRVELFANDAADLSGYGEGKTYLGGFTATNGTDMEGAITVVNGTDLTGKVISATTTATIADADGYGATSEFSEVTENVTVLAAATNDDTDEGLSVTGTMMSLGYILFSITVITTALGLKRFSQRTYMLR